MNHNSQLFEVRRTPVFNRWLLALSDTVAAARIQARIDRLGLGLFGDVKPVGEGISELRMDHGPGYRIYLAQRGKTLVILLCGGDKGSQARDIARAKSFAKELHDGA